jgi:hypothetical protein
MANRSKCDRLTEDHAPLILVLITLAAMIAVVMMGASVIVPVVMIAMVMMGASVIVPVVMMAVVVVGASVIVPMVMMAIMVNMDRAAILGSITARLLRNGQHRGHP